MTVRVGVIGVGMIGEDHVRRLSRVLSGGRVVALSDVDPGRAAAVAERLPGARVHPTGEQLIAADEVDAVLVTSWGPTHARYVLACLAAGKPVFCEKPLATTRADCTRVVEAEVALGRRLVQVGFMRRYDPAYQALKAVVDGGSIGPPLLFHSVHRNPSVPAHYTSDMSINDTAVHDIDVGRWLLADEIVAATVLRPRRSSRAPTGLHDPLLVLLESERGVLIDVEVSLSVRYGYDIRGEVVGETGTAALADGGQVVVTGDRLRGSSVPADWRERFARAYDVELQEWLDAVSAGACTGPSAWDGYCATAVADACLAALGSGERTAVTLMDRLDLPDT